MTISEILDAEQVRLDVDAASKKRALETLSDLLASADPDLNSRAVFDRLLARERLGSTGLGVFEPLLVYMHSFRLRSYGFC